MSKTSLSDYMIFLKALLYLFLLINSPSPVIGIRPIEMELIASPAPAPSPDYVSFKPTEGIAGQHGLGSRPAVENCLPKGLPRTSAPSRYINSQTLGSTLCSTSSASSKGNMKKLP
ncbi:hypothetical protein L484_013029 [Morus notabilis]|uniref:Uncharacterized protein n=1 Tax=Morus notabilis TaxID=981085 RepID=W9SA65_9ROSA|nr:hypothetical protein L484_013029 [Morus notabilis]